MGFYRKRRKRKGTLPLALGFVRHIAFLDKSERHEESVCTLGTLKIPQKFEIEREKNPTEHVAVHYIYWFIPIELCVQ